MYLCLSIGSINILEHVHVFDQQFVRCRAFQSFNVCTFETVYTVPQLQCINSFVFYILSYLFPLPCGAGSIVPREGFDSSVIMPFSWCIVAVTLPIKCRSKSSFKPPYIHFRFVASIHGGSG